MAIDTENKRRFVGGVPPRPDGAIDSADRRHIAGIYPFGVTSTSLCGSLSGDSLLTGTLTGNSLLTGTLSNTECV
jgi:hypothetical protein